MDNEIIIDEIKKGNCIITYDSKWRYPDMNSTQKNCKMLQVMFDIEYKSGYIVFIPYKEEK